MTDAVSETLANLWQTTLGGSAADALCLVELRGFEPLTPCMPSRDPRHGLHHETSRSWPLQRSRRAITWWFVRVRRAELLRICCAKWLERRVHRGELLARRSLAHGWWKRAIGAVSYLFVRCDRPHPQVTFLGGVDCRQLEAEGQRVVVQAWDSGPGRDWAHERQQTTTVAERVDH